MPLAVQFRVIAQNPDAKDDVSSEAIDSAVVGTEMRSREDRVFRRRRLGHVTLRGARASSAMPRLPAPIG